MKNIEPNENWRQLLFLHRSYKLVQDLRIGFDNTERNYRRDWQQYIEEIGQDPLELVWELGKTVRKRFIKAGGEKVENAWSEGYWVAKMKVALQCNRTYIEYLSKMFGFSTAPISACALLGMIGDPLRFKGLQSLYHYAGLHVVKGQAPKRRRGQKIDWNPALRALLLKSIADSLTRKKSPYRKVYEKYREEEKKKHNWRICEQCQMVYEKSKKNTEKGHVNNRARRKVVKDFVKDLWNYWKHGNLP